MSEIRDESLWESGKRKIEWVRQNMSLLRSVRKISREISLLRG